ncbi:MAG: hypothetical protein ACOYJB_03300 [Christensenellaceae bacterium]
MRTVLRNTFDIYKHNFPKLFLPLLVFQIVLLFPVFFFAIPGTVSAARTFLVLLMQGGGAIGSLIALLGIIALIALFVSPVVICNTVHIIDSNHCGHRVTFRESFAFSKGCYTSMLKTYFSTLVMLIPVAIVAAIIAYAAFSSGVDLKALSPGQIAALVVIVTMLLLFLLGTVFVPYVVVSEHKSGFLGTRTSFTYIFKGGFWSNLGRLAMAALIVGAGMLFVNWLSTLPFRELVDLYLANPEQALAHPLMVSSILISLLAVVVIAFIMPIWYSMSYGTYQNAKHAYEHKMKIKSETTEAEKQ